MFARLRAFAQTTTYLGLAVIACIWCGVFFLTNEEHERAYEEGVRQSSNLAHVFEMYMSRVIGGADSVLLTLRDLYEHDPQGFDIADAVSRTKFQNQNNVIFHFGIVGPNGLMKLSSMQSIPLGEGVGDREYFRFHTGAGTDELYISAPIPGRITGKLVVQLTRRLTAPDGSFGGVILAAIDLLQLEKSYDSIDIGHEGAISLIGFDGIVRARTGRDPSTREFVGQPMPGSKVLALYRQSPTGTFWNFQNATPQYDGVRRLISYQVVDGFPLIAVVGLAENDLFRQATASAHKVYLIAFALTASVIGAIGIGARRQRKLSSTLAALEQSKRSLEGSKLSLEQTNLWFNTALENMAHGLCMFDREQRLLVCNERYGELYGLTRDQTKPGTTLRSILEARVVAGNSPEDADTYVEQTLQMTQRPDPYYAEAELRNKRIFALNYQPMPGGGWVATHEDITEAKRKEASFRLLFDSNPVPMWVFDRDSLRFLAVNDAAVAHYGYSHDQFLAMSVLDVRPAEDRAKIMQFMKSMPENQRGMNAGRHQKSDGTKISVSVFSQSLSYAGHRAQLVAVHDVTKQKLSEHKLRRTQKFLDTIIEHVPLPISVKEAPSPEADVADYRITLVNRAYEDLMGNSRVDLMGRTVREIYSKERADGIVASDHETLQSNQSVLIREHVIATSAKGDRIVTAKKVAIRDDDGKPQYLLAVLDDVTERKRDERRIAHLAHHDSLTDLPNRAAFNEFLSASLKSAATTCKQFAVLSIDLDRFKEVNDVFGHAVGDALLREIATRLQSAAGSAFLARLGGDELAIIATDGAAGPSTAAALADRLLAAVTREYEIDGHRLRIGVSIGVAIFPTDGTDASSLLANSDAALYRAKAEGRGAIRFFEAEMDSRLRERRVLQQELHCAIDHGELFLNYQPQALIGREIVGFEALLRWKSPTRGLISPATFIPLAEESGLIIPIGEWILREACREAASWPRPLQIAVNLSPIQFRHGDLAALVHSVLLETGLAPSRLELEITEGVLIDDFSRALSILRRLKSLGVRIAMDDFGSGYSSLSYLQSFPFDKIKIDRTFISNVNGNPQSAAIIRAVIGLSRGLNLPVVAEGVETEDQLSFLSREDCNEVQGYLIGYPHPIGAYAELVGRPKEADSVGKTLAG
jgi:diguanylate cyclase (GGDEF)-like protein/PAS domain S-box-containing protein